MNNQTNITQVSFAIKNMVGRSCIKLVELYFDNVKGIEMKNVFLGEVHLSFDEKLIQQPDINEHFKSIGFEILEDSDAVFAEKVKVAAIELIMLAGNNNSIIRNSEYISDKVLMPYDKLSKIFSKVTGTTIEKYIILLKIEKIKELILQDELTLSEIAYQMGYSSVQYLSRQFKQITNYTFSEFKELENPPRKSLESILS